MNTSTLRTEFENWLMSKPTLRSVTNPPPLTMTRTIGAQQDRYFYGPVNHAWEAWQAARATHEPVYDKSVVRRIATQMGWRPGFRVQFPTALRKMWSGGEVQAWLDANVNSATPEDQEATSPPA